MTKLRGISGVLGSFNATLSSGIFERDKERKTISSILCNKTTELVVVTGPRDTGKTRLVKSVKRETEMNDRLWWLHINMRDMVHHWTSVVSVYKSLLLTFTSAFYRYAIDAAKTFLNSIRLSLPPGPSVTTANVSWRLPPEHNIEGSFEEMLSAAEKVLIGMKQSLWSGQHVWKGWGLRAECKSLLIVSYRKTCNSQPLDSYNQNPQPMVPILAPSL